MSVYLCIPSARPVDEAEACLQKWRDRGYKLAIFREMDRGPVKADLLVNTLPYRGYAAAVNLLAKLVLDDDSECNWIVAAGDDTDPDPTHEPEDIALECSEYFSFGVMQPTGDPWSDGNGRIIERIAGSPWLGREWCRRAYGGRGPLWPEYYHTHADEELQLVAKRLGVFWQRPDLIQMHHNWARGETVKDRVRAVQRGAPEFLKYAHSQEQWDKYQALFNARKAAGFPGSDPL